MKPTFKPHPAQVQIHRALLPALSGIIVMVIAGRRFGKTALAINEIIKRAIEIPGARIWYVAPTKDQAYNIAWRLMLYPRLNKATREVYPPYLPTELIKKANESKHFVELWNGSLIEFKGVQEETFLLGAGLEFVVVDEFPTIPWSVWYDTINPMLSDNDGDALFIGTLPDPKVHEISPEFVEMYETIYNGDCPANHQAFLFSSFENPHVSHKALKQKIEDLEKKGRGQDAQRLYYGKYTREFGKVFTKLDYDRHTFKPFQIPANWTRVMAIDPHPQKPYFGLWGAVDLRGIPHYWFYREKVFMDSKGTRPLTLDEIAYEIMQEENKAKERINLRVIDPTYAKVEVKTLGQKCVQSQLKELGLHFREGNRDRMTWFNDMTNRLVAFPEPTVHISRDCPVLWRQLDGLTWDSWSSARARQEKGSKDTWKKIDDDLPDCMKMIMNTGVRPVNRESLASFRSRLERRWEQGQYL